MTKARIFCALVPWLLSGSASTALAVECTAPACVKLIDNGPDAEKRVMVVMGDGYTSAGQASFNGDVDRMIVNGVFATDLWAEQHNAFNVYRLNLDSVDSGVSQRTWNLNGPGPADDTIMSTTMRNTVLQYIYNGIQARCWLEDSFTTAGALQNVSSQSLARMHAARYLAKVDDFVVILNEGGPGGCGMPGFATVTRVENPITVAHELGHGFGLADEYVPTNPNAAYAGGYLGPNCSAVADRTRVHWRRFIDPATPVPTVLGGAVGANDVGEFLGCNSQSNVYRPLENCRMRSNTPRFCPVCSTLIRKSLFPKLKHDFTDAHAGDFDGDGRADVLIHTGRDVAIYKTSFTKSYALDWLWIGNNRIAAAASPGLEGAVWSPSISDQYQVADFDGDRKDDVFVFHPGFDGGTPGLGLLRSTGSGLEGVGRYSKQLLGWGDMRPHDRFHVGDFTGDGKADLVVFNGLDWPKPYLALFRSTGMKLELVKMYEQSLPGWYMSRSDQLFVGDFDGDGKKDLYFFNPEFPGTKATYFGMLRSTGTEFITAKVYLTNLPNWQMGKGDRYSVGDFNGDGKDDVFVFNGADWSHAYLGMLKSNGNEIALAARYDSSSASASIPGWNLRKRDHIVVGDANADAKADLFLLNTQDWPTGYLGTALSDGSALRGSWSSDRVGGWKLSSSDMMIPANYSRPGANPTRGQRPTGELFIRNTEWFGMIRRGPSGFGLDRLFHYWIYSPPYDSNPASDSLEKN